MKRFLYLLPVLIGSVVWWGYTSIPKISLPTLTHETEIIGPAVIEALLLNTKLETAEAHISVPVPELNKGGNAFTDYFVGERLVLFASGSVRAGFNGDTIATHYQVRGKTITFNLGAPQILSVTLLNKHSWVMERKTSLLNFWPDPELETRARRRAEEELLRAACKRNILTEAATSARQKFASVFGKYFEQVEVIIHAGTCTNPPV